MRKGLLAVMAGAGLFVSLTTVETVLGQDRDEDRLPDRSTMLRSDDTACDGVLVLATDPERDDVLSVRRGESRVVEIDDENVRWACFGQSETRADTMECPAETTHVRVMRRGDDAIFECHGRGRA